MSEDKDQAQPIANPDYEVGYGRPPKSTQFKPGQSGNPNGRARKPKSVRAQVEKVVSRMVQINEGGTTKRLPLQEVIFRTIANKAAKGDLSAAKFVFSLLHAPEYAETDVIDQAGLAPEDQAMLDEMMARFAEPNESDLPPAEYGKENMNPAVECPQDQERTSPTLDKNNIPLTDTGYEDDVDDR